MATQGPQNI